MSISPKTKQKKEVEWSAKFQVQRQGGEVEDWIEKLTPINAAFDDRFLTKNGFKLVKEYDFTGPVGDPMYQSVRYEHKTIPKLKRFLQRRVDPDSGTWIFGAGPVKVPYRWPDLISDSTADVYACEGEKDADRLASIGLCATTVAGQNWSETAIEALRDRNVVIMEDNDAIGRKNATDLSDDLLGIARSIRVVLLPDLPPRGDVSDWLDAGHTKEELIEIVAAIPVTGDLMPVIDISGWDGVAVPDQEWAVPDRIPLRNTTMFTGIGAAGKSLIELQRSVAHVLGVHHHGVAVRQGPAIFVDAEDGKDVMHKRLADIVRHYGASFADVWERGLKLVSLVGRDAVLGSFNRKNYRIEPTKLYHELLAMAERLKPASITIASSANVFGGSEIDRTQVVQFVQLLTGISQAGSGSGLVLIAHPSLAGISTDTGLSGTTQWHNACRARFYIKGVKSGRNGNDDAEPVDTNLRTIEYRKNNYGPVSETVTVRYQGGLFLPIADSEADPEVKAALADDMFLTVMKKLIDQGQDLVEASNSQQSASTKIANHPVARAFTKQDMERAKQRLLDTDKIHIANSSGPPSRARKVLRLGPGSDGIPF